MFFDIIVNFIIQKFKSKRTSLKKIYKLSKINWGKLIYFPVVLREREENNPKYFAPVYGEQDFIIPYFFQAWLKKKLLRLWTWSSKALTLVTILIIPNYLVKWFQKSPNINLIWTKNPKNHNNILIKDCFISTDTTSY